MSYVTPTSLSLDEGNYELRFPVHATVVGKDYDFQAWADGAPVNIDTTNQEVVRNITLNSDQTVQANYVEVITTTLMTFTGKASAQAAAGEQVTVKVTLPDLSTQNLVATTDAQGNYSTTKDYAPGAGYKGEATIPEDAQYLSATSPVVTFTVGKAARTITLNVA
jgi:hypothetical protein